MNLQPTVKMHFFLSRGTLLRRLFLFWKKLNNLAFSFKKWAEPFKKFITMNFWQKKSAPLSQLDSTLPEGLFADFFSRKRINCENVFATWAEVRYVLSKKNREIREKCITASRWICWGKICFLWRNNVLQVFSGRWEEKCWTLAKKINNIVRFALLSV